MVRKSSKLIGSLKNSGIERKEEELRNRLEGLEGELNGVGGGGRGGNFGNGIGGGNRGDHGNSGERLNPRINDLWASLSTAKISKAENRDGNGNGQEANLEWAMVDEDKLNEVTRVSVFLTLPSHFWILNVEILLCLSLYEFFSWSSH